MSSKIKVLFLPRWYPHKHDPMPGLFIQRQAEALTSDCDVAVIYVHPDPNCPNKIEVDFCEENQVRVMRVYYRPPENPTSQIGRIINLLRYYKSCMKAIRSIRQFEPDIIHAHILTRMGLIALKAGRLLKAPVIVSEHWSRYFPANNGYSGWLRKFFTRYAVRHAAAVVAVSEPLREAMKQCNLSNPDFRVIPNVVDTSLFYPGAVETKRQIKQFVHISCFEDKSKNISGFLRSVKTLSEIRQDFRCLLVGNGPDWYDMKEYAAFLRIPEELVQFPGVLNGAELADTIRNSDFSVLSSRYETFGIVVVESLSCGVPVVSTAVGISTEVINKQNGILVPVADENEMTSALNQMLDSSDSYNRNDISNGVSGRFDRITIAKQLVDLYREVKKSK